MRKNVVLVFVLICGFALPVFSQNAKKPAETKSTKSDWALVFNFENLLSAISPYDDGYQAGAGVKHWFTDKTGARALIYALVEPDSGTSTTTLGLSTAVEYHPRPGLVSPYFGGTLGCRFLLEPDQNYMDFFIGGIGGLEVKLFQNFSLYAEYQAVLVRDYDGLWFKLGTNAIIGLLIYF